MTKMKHSGIDWIGEIPEHWEVKRLKDVAVFYTGDSLNDEEKEIYGDCNITESLPYIGTKDVERDVNYINYDSGYCIPKNELDSFSIAPKGATLICIEGGSAGKKIGFVEQDVCFVNKLCCAKSFFEKSNKFLYFYFNSSLFINQFNLFLQGLIGGVSINRIKCMHLLFPPLHEQQAIANYLDVKTSEIDAQVSALEQKKYTYKRLKQSLISETITKGLNPNAPRKQSGIAWIGEIPEHWKIGRVKEIFSISRGRVIPITDMDDSFLYPVYSSQTQNNGCMGYIQTYDYKGEALTWTTDGANAGTVFYRNGKFNCTNVCGILQLKNINSNINYMLYSVGLSAYNCRRIDTNGYKIMSNEMAGINVVIPPLHEQQAIADYLDKKTAEIDTQMDLIEKKIDAYKRLKHSLIDEVVTGKRKIS